MQKTVKQIKRPLKKEINRDVSNRIVSYEIRNQNRKSEFPKELFRPDI